MMKRILFITLSVLMLFSSCVKKTLYDPTPPIVNPDPTEPIEPTEPEEPEDPTEPEDPEDPTDPVEPPIEEKTGILVRINWANLYSVDSVFLHIDEQNIPVSYGSQPDTILIDAGNYNIYCYNKPNNIAIDQNFIANIIQKDINPDIFYSAAKSIIIPDKGIIETDISLNQRIRQLSINIDFPLNLYDSTKFLISPDTAIFGNFASAFDIKNEVELKSDSIIGNIINNYCTINTFGILNTEPQFIINATFLLSGSDTLLIRDLGIDLDNFNDNKTDHKIINVFF